MMQLPDVTVVIVDCVNHALATQALLDTMEQIEPAAVHVWSDKRLDFDSEYFPVDLHNFDDVAKCLWHRVPREVKTSHYLTIQWDGWVLDGTRWEPQWLAYDYVGAPWPWHKFGQVGNGGFSLRSADMGRFLANHASRFLPVHPEDDTLCRQYRPLLESQGFIWAPEASAARFSFERSPPCPSFGFHGAFNWPALLSPEALDARIALASNYVLAKQEWKEMIALKRGLLKRLYEYAAHA